MIGRHPLASTCLVSAGVLAYGQVVGPIPIVALCATIACAVLCGFFLFRRALRDRTPFRMSLGSFEATTGEEAFGDGRSDRVRPSEPKLRSGSQGEGTS